MSENYSLSSPSLLPSIYRQIGWSGRSISCDNSIYGCTTRVDSLEERQKHKQECVYDPNAIIKCGECQLQLSRSELKYHNCIKEMRSSVKELQKMMNQLEEKVNQQSIQLNDVKQHLKDLESTQRKTDSDNTNGSTINYTQKNVNHSSNSSNSDNRNLFQSQSPLRQNKAISEESIKSIRVLPTIHTKNLNSSKSYTEEEVDFGMYGSQKYKYLSQLSRETSISPLIKFDSKQSFGIDFTKKNKQKLVEVNKQSDNINKKSPVVRLRSWSGRKDDN